MVRVRYFCSALELRRETISQFGDAVQFLRTTRHKYRVEDLNEHARLGTAKPSLPLHCGQFSIECSL